MLAAKIALASHPRRNLHRNFNCHCFLPNSLLIIPINLIFGGLLLGTRQWVVEGARDGISGSLGLGTTINSATPGMVQVQFVLVQQYGAHQVWWGLVFAEDTH